MFARTTSGPGAELARGARFAGVAGAILTPARTVLTKDERTIGTLGLTGPPKPPPGAPLPLAADVVLGDHAADVDAVATGIVPEGRVDAVLTTGIVPEERVDAGAGCGRAEAMTAGGSPAAGAGTDAATGAGAGGATTAGAGTDAGATTGAGGGGAAGAGAGAGSARSGALSADAVEPRSKTLPDSTESFDTRYTPDGREGALDWDSMGSASGCATDSRSLDWGTTGSASGCAMASRSSKSE